MKQIKDPVYGYIIVEDDYFPFIDSAEFQRLRNIRQTGYAALYPSALHNRFVHSLGVFHLGKIAINHFRKNIESQCTSIPWAMIQDSFILACLLHDVGHSPFSHTGEEYYKLNTDFAQEFKSLIQSKGLDKDIGEQGFGKPHEAMSALVGYKLLQNIPNKFKVDYEFFVRCIIGVTYTENDTRSSKSNRQEAKAEKILIYNTIIAMLNGQVIDVDKLDYLIRDSYVTGYNSIAIDMDRMLAAYTISRFKGQDNIEKKVAAYKKGAISVIENVVIANDWERRWIQSNPTVLYDCKLIEIAIKQYSEFMKSKYDYLKSYKTIFTETAISKNGFPQESGINLRLLSDDDIITYLKNDGDPFIRTQYFSRDGRYKPIWKSEVEFNDVVTNGLTQNTLIELRSILRTITSASADRFLINQSNLDKCKEESENDPQGARKEELKVYILLHDFSVKKGLDFEYAIIFCGFFESNYNKSGLDEIYIELNENHAVKFSETLSVGARSLTEDKQQGLFYFYTSRENLKKCKDLAKELVGFLNSHWGSYQDSLGANI